MPVRSRAVAPPKRAARDNPAVMAELDAAFKAAGYVSDEALRDRIAELVVLDRPFTDDERKEHKRLVREWHRRKAQKVKWDRRREKAREEWAAFTPAERAEWGTRAIASARRYDRGLVNGHATGEEFHYMHVVFQIEKRERQAAKRHERHEAREAADDAKREASLAASALEREQTSESPPPTPPAAALDDERPARPRRIKAGIAWVEDAYGNRV